MKQLLLVFGLFCLFGVGCGREPAGLSGQVTYNGKPIEQGFIRLDAIEEGRADGAAAKIVNGKYEFPLDGGELFVGTYHVAILGMKPTGRKVQAREEPLSSDPDDPPVEMSPSSGSDQELVQFVEPRFNSDTKLEITLEAGQNQKDWQLDGKELNGTP